MNEYDYDAAARNIKIDITSDPYNRSILRRLKENDTEFTELWVRNFRDIFHGSSNKTYCPEDARSLGWLGYYIGENTTLKELNFQSNPFQHFSNNAIEAFCKEVNRNSTIEKISFNYMDLSGGYIFQSLSPFFHSNGNLSELMVGHNCRFGSGCFRQLLLVLRVCSKSIKSITLAHSRRGEESLSDIIEGMAAHPQLEKLDLAGMNVGRNECVALSTILPSATRLKELNLCNNGIDDEGAVILASALDGNCTLRKLHLITKRGWRAIFTLLQSPQSSLENIYVSRNMTTLLQIC